MQLKMVYELFMQDHPHPVYAYKSIFNKIYWYYIAVMSFRLIFSYIQSIFHSITTYVAYILRYVSACHLSY